MIGRTVTVCSCILIGLFAVAGCGTEEVNPGNVITDDFGVTVELSWSTGGSALVAVREADLDLKLIAGDTLFSQSIQANQFEQLRIFGTDTNGEYTAKVILASTTRPVDYTLTVRGVSNVNANVYRATGTFADSDPHGTERLAVLITKNGRQFTMQAGD